MSKILSKNPQSWPADDEDYWFFGKPGKRNIVHILILYLTWFAILVGLIVLFFDLNLFPLWPSLRWSQADWATQFGGLKHWWLNN